MWIWFLVLTLLVLLAIAAVVVLLFRARTQALAIRPAGGAAEADGLTLTAMIRELRPSFADALQRLRKAVRGVDFRYGVPWYLMIGPADAGKSTLVAGAQTSATLGADEAGSRQAAQSLAWHYFDGGVIIDVAASLALPRRGDLSGWRALLHLLKRHRPRRPVDGIVLAIPASLLLDEQWKPRTQDLGAVVRERIVVAQAAFGFALPVYVVITQADRLHGFAAFAEALPESLQQGMIGWSNPHDPELLFQGEWVDGGFEELHRGVVRLQVELFATQQSPEQSSSLFLFSGEMRRLAVPLRHLLEEIFRPNAYRAAAFFRGFYLTGLRPERGGADAPETLNVCFFRDLLDSKVFAERGLATPLPGATIARNRVSHAALAAAAALALVLGIGTYWSYGRLVGARDSYTRFLTDVSTALQLHVRSQQGERSASVDERIQDGYRLLEQVVGLSNERLHSIFLPASRLSSIEPAVGGVVTGVFSSLILPDFRAGMEAKGTELFDMMPGSIPEEDSRGLSPVLADSARYRALETFAADYRLYVDNYFRYYEISGAGHGALPEIAELGNYLTGRSMLTPQMIPDEPFGRALRAASTAQRIDCSGFDGRVEQKARLLLTAFGASWFGDDNPVKAAEDRFAGRWQALMASEADLEELTEDLDTLDTGVRTWASIGARSGELRLPVLEREPFRPLESPMLDQCRALRPNLGDVIRRVALQRDGLTDALTTVDVEPFGALLVSDEKGLALGEDLQVFKSALDELGSRDFRMMTAVVEEEPALPDRVSWRPEVLDRAVAMFDSFDRYRGEAFASLDPAFRRPVVAALTRQVARAMATRLAFDAATADPLPSESAALQEAVQQLGDRLGKVSQLLPLLQDGDEPFAAALITELDDQAVAALEQLEADASAHHPYVFTRQSEFVLSAWAETASDSATPADGLKRWAAFVDEQRESIRRYALEARPLVDFLELTNVASPLERRWRGLVEDVESFDRKLGGNGLMALDAFLRDGVPVITPDRDCTISGLVRARSTSSYLVGVRGELLDDAVARCRELSRSSIETRYAAIARAFNGTLAGRFPFSDALETPRDAAPADIVEFLRVFDRQDGRALLQQTASRVCTDGSVEFLRQVDALYPLLASARELKASGIAVDLLPEFRVNRDGEVGGNQIAEWQLQVGRTTFREGDGAKPARWTSGDPVRLVLRFARDSPNRPARGGEPWRRADNRTVTFAFDGAWGLLGLLHAGRPAPADLLAARDAEPHTLRLEIPVDRDPGRPQLASAAPPAGPFRVFLRLRLFAPGKPDPIVIDGLPIRAPADVTCAPKE